MYGTTGAGGNSGRGTARGVLHGIRASVEHVFGSPDLRGPHACSCRARARSARDLARDLAADGAEVLVSDVDEARARGDRTRRSCRPPRRSTTECDVYSPCAVGGTLNAETIPQLRCRIVAGSANNQLAEPEDAERLRGAGILYAPDYVINAGGVIQLVGLEDRGWTKAELERNLAGIGDTLRRIYATRSRRRHARGRGGAASRGAHRAGSRR